MKPDWRTIRCYPCGGHGLTADISSDGGLGCPRECNVCGGSGVIYVRPSGHLFLWPGGPARGMVRGAYEHAEAVSR